MKRMMRLTAAFGVVFAMVLGSPTPAKADPITAAIVTGIGLTGTAAAVATFIVNGVFSTAFSWAAGKLLGKSKGSVQERQASVTTLSLGEVPREALIGEAVTGGSLIDAFNHGGRYGTDYVTRCIALTDHVVDALVGYYIDDQYFAFTANGVQAGFSGALDIEFVNATQAGAAPPARFLTASAGSWAATDVLASITHVWFSYKCDEAVWPQGHPQVRFLLRGLKVYDPRKDAALGYSGAGPQTWADPSTHTFSRNAALLRYAFARGIYATGRQGQPEHLLIGRGLSAEEAPPESVIAAANLCDETVGGAARYTANGVIRASDDFIVVEEMFAAAMAGVIVQREGGVEIEPGQAKAAVVTITDADLVAGEPVTFSEFLPDGDGGRVNTVIPRYVEPAQNWKDHSGPVRRNQADIATDRGPREITLPLMLVTAGAQADRCAEITRRLGRLERRTTIVLPPEYGRLEEGDWIAWTSARRFAGGTVRWRIESWTLDEKWRMRLSLREIASSVFTDPTALTDGSDPPSDPGDLAPLDLQGVTAQVVLLSGSGSAVPAVRFTWSAVDPGVIAIRAEVRRDGETVAAPTRTDEVSAGTMTVTNGVGPDQAIQVRLVPITRLSRPVTPSAWVSLTTGSLTAGDVVPITPGNVAGTPTISITSTIASDGTQTSRLFGTWTAPSNALSYVVELDNGTIVQQFPVTENAIEDRIVATGPTYRYRVKALSRTGTLSAAWSSWSANATAAGKTTKPPAITSGSATAIGGRRVRVVQKRPAMADYLHTLIYRNTTGFSPDDVPQGVYTVATDEEFVDVNVTVGVNYRYYARTVDRSGNEADTATFLGSAVPIFTSVSGGDVNPTDPDLVTGYGTSASTNNAPWSVVSGAGRPSDNAGTIGHLRTMGLHTTIVGNKVIKGDPGTHGTFQGGAVGTAQNGSAYISGSILSAGFAAGWITFFALDDDASSFVDSAQNYYITVFANGVGTGEVALYADGTYVGAASGVPLNTNSRATIAYDGQKVMAIVDGVVYLSAPARPGQRLFPKVLDYFNSVNSAFPSGVIDVRYGAWTENTVSTVTLVPYNAETSVTGSTATKVGGGNGSWGGGVSSREKYVGAAYCSFRFGPHGQPYAMAGLVDVAFGGNYVTLNYALFTEGLPASSPIYVYQSGSFVANIVAAGAWAITDVWSVVYDGVRVQYLQNGIVRHTSAAAAGQTLGFGASQVYINNSLTDIQVGPANQVARIGQNTYDDSGGALVGRSNLITSLGTANNILNQTAAATAPDFLVFNNRTDGGSVSVRLPAGGGYSPGAPVTGCLKIRLPQNWSNTMLQFIVDIYDYNVGHSVSYILAGYAYFYGPNPNDGTWLQHTAQFIGPRSRAMRVRFGHDGSYPCVYIGETSTVWEYPAVRVKDVNLGYLNIAESLWSSGWSVSLATSVGTITAEILVPRAGDQVFGEGLLEAPTGSGLPGAGVVATRATHRTDQGTAAFLNGEGPLARSLLTEDKVRGRYLGEHAGNAAAVTAGIQNGDTYVDNSLTPFGFKVQSGGVIKEVDTSGLFRGFTVQADINSTTMSDKVTLTLPNIQTNSYMVVWMAMDIELTPARTRKSGGTPGINPQGTWEIVEDATGGSAPKVLLSGTWEANRVGSGGSADNIESFTVDGVGEPNSDISRRWRVRAGGSRTWKLRMKTNSGENLLAVGLNVLVQIQRNPS